MIVEEFGSGVPARSGNASQLGCGQVRDVAAVHDGPGQPAGVPVCFVVCHVTVCYVLS